jgi:hypothetical protein
MADTWFTTTLAPEKTKSLFNADYWNFKVFENSKGKYIYFELHDDNGYAGWVFINEDGTIEFGEPGV